MVQFLTRVSRSFSGKRVPFSTNGAETTIRQWLHLDMKPKVPAIKEITDKLDFIKITNICASKYTIKYVKGKTHKTEKIFTNLI